MLEFDLPKAQSSIIKVIGVGGGGNNAVNHMFELGIKGVDFVNCNTDGQVLEASKVPNKIHFGALGTGAGNNPEKGRQLAEESADKIRNILEKNTEMVFITAGMGGGTGTGAAPVVAAIARGLDILTVGIVTEPFAMEGKRRSDQAKQGIREMRKYVDVLLVINNDRLREQYGNLKLGEAFQKADDVLANAAKGIAEIITVRGYMNVDLEDVKAIMRNSGTAIMGIGMASGEDRATKVVDEALNSPLLNNIDIRDSKNLLIYITYGDNEVTMDEMGEITELVHERTGNNADLILGHGHDEKLGDQIAVSIIATGFKMPGDKPGDKIEPVAELPLYTHPKETVNEPLKIFPLNEEVIIDNNVVITPPENIIPTPAFHPVSEEKEEKENIDELINFKIFVKDEPGVIAKEEIKEEIKEMAIKEAMEKEEMFTFMAPTSAANKNVPDSTVAPATATPSEPFILKTAATQPATPTPNPAPSINATAPQTKKPLKVIVADEDDDLDFHLSDRPKFATNHQSSTPVVDSVNDERTTYPRLESTEPDRAKSRMDRLNSFTFRSKQKEMQGDIEQPAYRRRNVQFEQTDHSSTSQVSDYSVFEGENGKPEFRHNPYLHDNVD